MTLTQRRRRGIAALRARCYSAQAEQTTTVRPTVSSILAVMTPRCLLPPDDVMKPPETSVFGEDLCGVTSLVIILRNPVFFSMLVARPRRHITLIYVL